jgi:MoxR-like ATPase
VKFELIGRSEELEHIEACLRVHRHVLLEGPVGVGKTTLALAVTERMRLPVFRIDGDGRYSEQKLTGWFDPPKAIQVGYLPAAFVPGPLVEAMYAGGVLLINELNRLPEGVQNILLPAMDERKIIVPRLGEVRAEAGFRVIATQNPKEFVATSHLSEAILDRFELISLDYQSELEEMDIVLSHMAESALGKSDCLRLAAIAVQIVRATRVDPCIRRGASVRAAIGIAEIATALLATGIDFELAVTKAVLMALPTRIEMERHLEGLEGPKDIKNSGWLSELTRVTLAQNAVELKKKTDLVS